MPRKSGAGNHAAPLQRNCRRIQKRSGTRYSATYLSTALRKSAIGPCARTVKGLRSHCTTDAVSSAYSKRAPQAESLRRRAALISEEREPHARRTSRVRHTRRNDAASTRLPGCATQRQQTACSAPHACKATLVSAPPAAKRFRRDAALAMLAALAAGGFQLAKALRRRALCRRQLISAPVAAARKRSAAHARRCDPASPRRGRYAPCATRAEGQNAARSAPRGINSCEDRRAS